VSRTAMLAPNVRAQHLGKRTADPDLTRILQSGSSSAPDETPPSSQGSSNTGEVRQIQPADEPAVPSSTEHAPGDAWRGSALKKIFVVLGSISLVLGSAI